MSAWRDLVSTAVVGTERRSVPAEVTARIAAIVDDPVPAGAEERALVAAGVLGAWRRAGLTAPPGTGALPDPAPDDARPTASDRAVQLLELLVDGHAAVGAAAADLVADWLARCVRSGHRLPARMLPRILDAATATPPLRAPALDVGGPALRWLAARNPAWAWASRPATATTDDVALVWAEGTRDERLATLEALRAVDPAATRALLEDTWAREPAADRARFVAALATGLSPDDEPFLEAALDDRAATVRVAAAGLLATLPTSALARRMAERLRPLLTVEASDRGRWRAGRTRLVVGPPDEIDPAAARDGIVARGAPPGTGRRAWALVQIVGATPLAFWEREVGGGPEDAVPLGAGSDELLAGWTLAAARQRNTAWARQLLRYRQDPALLAALPPPVAHDELTAALPRVADDALVPLLTATPGPWPAATSRAVVARLRAVEGRHVPAAALPVVATALDPEVAADVQAWTDALRRDEVLRSRLQAVVQALSLRRAIARELG